MEGKVAIVGGGLAGLACSRKLKRLGIESTIFEASDRPGGRVKTDLVDGFLLDRGFQVLFSAYPHAREEIGSFEDAGIFGNGAYIWMGTANHFVHFDADNWLNSALSPVMTLGDKFRFLRLKNRLLRAIEPNDYGVADESANDYFARLGFSARAMTRFLRPFLGGVFADAGLTVSREQLFFVLKMLFAGKTLWPKQGIEEIVTRQLRDEFAPTVRTNSPVAAVSTDGYRVDGVILATGEVFEANAVVFASGPREIGMDNEDADFRQSIKVHFEPSRKLVPRGFLIINGTGGGMINHVAPLSNVSPSCCPVGRHYASATILGSSDQDDSTLAKSVVAELNEWFGKGFCLKIIRIDRIRHAQLRQTPLDVEKKRGVAVGPAGLFRATEYVTNSSIDGAIEAGHLAAETVRSYL